MHHFRNFLLLFNIKLVEGKVRYYRKVVKFFSSKLFMSVIIVLDKCPVTDISLRIDQNFLPLFLMLTLPANSVLKTLNRSRNRLCQNSHLFAFLELKKNIVMSKTQCLSKRHPQPSHQ